MDTVHECDRRTDGQTDGQNYDHKDRATVQRRASHGKNCLETCRAIRVHFQRQKCSSGKLRERSYWQHREPNVYADIRGGSLEIMGRQMRVGSLKMAIFATFVHCLLNNIHGHTTAFT